MDRRSNNIAIFQDSMDLIKANQKLQQAVQFSIQNQKLYVPSQAIALPEPGKSSCKTIVSSKRSFEAASAYAKAGKRVCVLNFASATNPGGGVTRGSTAQEECLCRCSTLYPCLDTETMWHQFYQPHRKTGDPLYNDDLLYTPEVVVFKTDTSAPERMEEKDWYQVDIITCAAPNLRKKPSNAMNPSAGNAPVKISEKTLYELQMQRLERVFRAAASNGAEVLILGAFGCGAFCNPPRIVARAFRSVQEKYASYFETIEYAVFCGRNAILNYDRKENPYMFAGDVRRVRFKIEKDYFTQVVDWFGEDFRVYQDYLDEKCWGIEVRVSTNSFIFWVLQYGGCTEVVETGADDRFRENVKLRLNEILQKYLESDARNKEDEYKN